MEDLTYCRVQHEKIRDLSTLIYFIERAENSSDTVVIPELKDVFVQECSADKITTLKYESMMDRSLRMFTWVYLNASSKLDPE